MVNVIRRYQRIVSVVALELSKTLPPGSFVASSVPEPGEMIDITIDNVNPNYAVDLNELMALKGFQFIGENPASSLEFAASSEVPPITRIRESGGAELNVGPIANGQQMQRSGTAIIGVAPGGGGGGIDTRDVFLEDHFFSGNIDIDEIGKMGWRSYATGTGNDITFFQSQAGRPGILQLNGGTAGSARSAIALGDDLGVGGRIVLGGTNPINLEFLMRIPTAADLLVANVERIECGFGLGWGPDVQLPDALVLRWDPAASAFWNLVAANAGVRSAVSTGIIPVVAVWIRFNIRFTTGLGAELFINDALVASLNTNIPVVALGVGIKISANSGVGCMAQWDYIRGTQITNKEGV